MVGNQVAAAVTGGDKGVWHGRWWGAHTIHFVYNVTLYNVTLCDVKQCDTVGGVLSALGSCHTIQCDTIRCDTVRCDTVWYDTIQCDVTLYNEVLPGGCSVTLYDVTWCSAVWHGAVTDHPDPNTHNPSNTHCHILCQLQNKIHSSAFLVHLKWDRSVWLTWGGSHSVTNWPKLPEGLQNTLYREDLKRGVGVVRGQLVSPTATLVMWTLDWESTWSHSIL